MNDKGKTTQLKSLIVPLAKQVVNKTMKVSTAVNFLTDEAHKLGVSIIPVQELLDEIKAREKKLSRVIVEQVKIENQIKKLIEKVGVDETIQLTKLPKEYVYKLSNKKEYIENYREPYSMNEDDYGNGSWKELKEANSFFFEEKTSNINGIEEVEFINKDNISFFTVNPKKIIKEKNKLIIYE